MAVSAGHVCAAPVSLEGAPTEVRDAARDNAVAFLNDVSSRRRTTTLFPNPQPPSAGVQESFVNTSTGTLTFLVRDLVRVGGMPVVMGRVYDSTLEDGADFGPGWKLTVLEEVRREGSGLLFTDASNGVHALDVSGGTVVPARRSTGPTPRSTRTPTGRRRLFPGTGVRWRSTRTTRSGGWRPSTTAGTGGRRSSTTCAG